ncbi:hypothetical protein WDZ92_00040 [Nostoc sp. NIES-2111]
MRSFLETAWFPYALYAVTVAVLWPAYRFDLSPDQVSYLNLAWQYAQGNWDEAVNGFWSPLLIWLMTPAIVCGLSPWLAAKVVCLGSGALLLSGFRRLIPLFAPAAPAVLTAIATVFTAAIALRTSADILSAGLLLHYFAEIWNPTWTRRPWRLGFLGALLYLAKNYLLFFFLLHLTFSALVEMARRSAWLTVARSGALAMGFMVVLSGGWIAILSSHYGSFTTSRAGAVNLRMVGPESSGYRQHKVLVAPSSTQAFSMLQDPPPGLLPTWNPASPEGIRQLIRLFKKNLRWLADIYEGETLLWLAIVLLFILTAETTTPDRFWIGPVLTLLLLPAGYLLVIVVDRYLWSTYYLFLLMGGAALARLSTPWPVNRLAWRCLAATGAASFLWAALSTARNSEGIGRTEWEIAQHLRPLVAPESHVLSCGAYESSLLISYHLGARFYGLIREGAEDRQYARELNPAYDRSTASKLPPVPPDIKDRLDRFRPDWLLIWPSCEGIPVEVQNRLQAPLPMQLPGGAQALPFRKNDP